MKTTIQKYALFIGFVFLTICIHAQSRWREDAGYGMFYDCKRMSNGLVSKTLYRTCIACKGAVSCGSCYGTARCSICQGRGGIVTAGYGRYIPCVACYQSGRCRICKGSGKCECANKDFPGYMPGMCTLYGSDGRIISSTNYSGGGSSSSTSSRSCSSCGGTGVCKRCHGKCGDYKDTGYYTGSPSKSWINCGGCNGNGKCSICRGMGRL